MKNYVNILITLLLLFLATGIHGQSFTNYKKGCYYDSEGIKAEGFIFYGYDYKRKIKFKETEESKRKILRPKHIKGFTIEMDSFAVIKNFQIEGLNGGLHDISDDFAEVVLSGEVILYKHYSSQGSGSFDHGAPINSLVTYLLRKNGSNKIVTVRRKKKRFIKTLSVVFEDNKQINEDILNGKYSKGNIEELVSKYNGS